MSDRPMESSAESGDKGSGGRAAPEPKSGTSRWQKVIAIIGLVALVLLGMRMFASGGHGSGQDGPGQQQEEGGHQPPAWVPDH